MRMGVDSKVPAMFDRVAQGYDQLTGLNPGYQRHLDISARRLELGPEPRVLDLCCGTGASVEAILRARPDAHVVGLDASAGMLAVARQKNLGPNVALVLGDAMDPASAGVEGPFDGILMAYGIRNMREPDRCLARIRELLRPGGRLCLHEYSLAGSVRSRLVWNAVTLGVIVPMGLALTREAGIYRYLRRSVLDFDSVAELEDRMRRAGFREVHSEPMDGWQRGVVHSFLGRRPG